MPFVIRNMGLVGKAVLIPPGLAPGQYLREFDPEFMGGRGRAEWTRTLNEALKFDTPAKAMLVWQTQPKCKPFRSDGRPNRPLTAFTIEIEQVD